jgi:cellulose synthase/poly-beta-1,6-N-acetylglucosamine synthase-like glycosyltransferase/putative flippase GtrA
MTEPGHLRRIISFLAGGGLVSIVGMALLYGQVHLLHVGEQIAFEVQLVITIALNFAYNQLHTWRDVPGATIIRRAWIFLLTRGATLLLSLALFAGLTSAAVGLHYMAANVVCLGASTVLNYYSSHRYVFTAAVVREGEVMTRRRPVAAVMRGIGRQSSACAGFLCVALVLVSYLMWGAHATVVACIVTAAILFGNTAAAEVWWRLYGRRDPAAMHDMKFPQPGARSGQDSFSIIVCAKNEAEVLRRTLELLALQTHPHVQIIASLIEGDTATIEEAEAVRERYPDRLEILVQRYHQEMKPHQQNAALLRCRGTYVGVIDAEDETALELLEHVEASFQATGADVVQGPVQLMNLGMKLREWFCVHNVLEYFFWFSSRMMFQARHGFVPLGGNTVFIRRELLVRANGWPISLTEDCALGVKLSTEYGAKVVAFYDPALATREETPDNIHGLLHQRIRWDTGFGVELLGKQWWHLPSMGRRILAWYILATPFLQAATGLLLPVTLVSAFLLDAPVGLVMLTFLPYVPILTTLLMQFVGLREFGQIYGQRVRLRHYVFLALGFYPYQLVLAWAAICAVIRISTGNMSWWKSPHSNKHRVTIPVVTPIEEVA